MALLFSHPSFRNPRGWRLGLYLMARAVFDHQPKAVILGQSCDLQLVLLLPPAVGEQRGVVPGMWSGVRGVGV